MNSVPDLQRQRERQNKDPRSSRACSTLVETTRETQNCDLTSQKKKAKTNTGEATLIDVLNTQLKDSTHAKLINELMCSTRITKMWRCFVFRFPVESTMACSLFGKQNTGWLVRRLHLARLQHVEHLGFLTSILGSVLPSSATSLPMLVPR